MCSDLKKLVEHLDYWVDVLSNYGHELEHHSRLLRSMVLAIIPKIYENELLTKPECTRTHHDIIQWSATEFLEERVNSPTLPVGRLDPQHEPTPSMVSSQVPVMKAWPSATTPNMHRPLQLLDLPKRKLHLGPVTLSPRSA